MTLGSVSAADAVAFVRRWHYSGSAAPGTFRFGWYDGDELVGVSIYNTGTNAMRAGVFGAEHTEHVFHHHRLALKPGLPTGAASEFIGACHAALRREHPEVWAIITYAELSQGHNGTIYRATNALYTGMTGKGNLYFKDSDGGFRTTQGLAWVGPWPERRKYAAAQGWTEERSRGRARYVYLLGTQKQRRSRPEMLWPVLGYDEVPDGVRE